MARLRYLTILLYILCHTHNQYKVTIQKKDKFPIDNNFFTSVVYLNSIDENVMGEFV